MEGLGRSVFLGEAEPLGSVCRLGEAGDWQGGGLCLAGGEAAESLLTTLLPYSFPIQGLKRS